MDVYDDTLCSLSHGPSKSEWPESNRHGHKAQGILSPLRLPVSPHSDCLLMYHGNKEETGRYEKKRLPAK